MTDPRARLTTAPGIGPLELSDTSATLCPIELSPDVTEVSTGEPSNAKPKLLVVQDGQELPTVVIADEADPRKQETWLSLPRPPVQPVSDSGWPQAEVVLMTSQRPPMLPARSWRVPALLFAFAGALLLLGFARLASHRVVLDSAAVRAAQPMSGASLESPLALRKIAPAVSVTALPAERPVPALNAPSVASVGAVHGVPPRVLAAHLNEQKPNLTRAVSEAAPSASVPDKPKRAIY